MARILLYTSPAPGHIYPPIPTALELRDRGRQVSIRTGSDNVESLARLGFDAKPIDPRIEAVPVEDWKARTPIGANRKLVDLFDQWARYEIPDIQGAIEAESPDLIWVDANSAGASAAAEAFRPARMGLNAHRSALGLPELGRYEEIILTAPLVVQFSAEPFEYPRIWPENVRLVGPAIWEPPAPEPEWLAAEERAIECRPAAGRVGEAFAQAGGPDAAATALETLLPSQLQSSPLPSGV